MNENIIKKLKNNKSPKDADIYDLFRKGYYCFSEKIENIHIYSSYKDYANSNTMICFYYNLGIEDKYWTLARFILKGQQIGNSSEGKQAAEKLWKNYRDQILSGIDRIVTIESLQE